ncbi:eukaryotic translation initiation factor 4B-like isoform X2 [Amphibalanus amphitrite]|uniref:eukaryotic translation initiation factor 4B-like isoform X2 n=1 Tax=Amphibalanus amphitrite TaxID=1232801 RepID=UPI001C905646|nr:eukaryotic translation initiation factor 4B-like isoform X2 [Amphibalanus amphitrite]
MASAPSGKKKGRKKGVPIDLNVFLSNTKGTPDGKAITITKTGNSWADQMDFEAEEKTVVLPTAPSSVRCGLNVDLDRVPMTGPFKLFIANVSYDANEEMVASMFQGLDVRNVSLPCDDSGRFRGFGYVEFGNRDDLIEALHMDDLEVAGRKLRIDLKTPSERDQQQQSRGYSSFGRDEDRDRAEDDGDWRAGPRAAPARTNSDWRSGPPGGGDRPDRSGGDSDWRGGPRGGGGGGSDFGGGYGRDREREPTMASKPGSKYEAVPSFNDYRGGGGGYGSDRRSDDRYGGRDDRFGGRDDRYGGRDDRYGGRDDRYGDRGRGYGGGGYGYDRRGDVRGYDSRYDRGYGDRDRGGGGGGFDRRDDRYGDRGRDDRYGGSRFGSRDGPRYDSRDGPRYDSRDGPRDGPRYDSRDGPRDGPRYDSRDGPRYDSRDGPRDGPRYDDRPPAESDRPPAERPKLNLKPRSVPSDDIGKPAASSSIFGGAKPVDTTAREREVEERLKATRIDDRPARPTEPASGSQRRAEASRDIRLSEPARGKDSQPADSAGSRETNGKAADGAEKKERAPRPPKTLEDKPAVFVEQSRFSALAEDEEA